MSSSSIRTRTSGIMVDINVEPTSSGFTPLDLPNLLAWYKADAGVYSDAGITPATDGQNVAQWNDQSGNGYHVSNGGGTGLVYRTNQLNGLPILDNDGTMAALTSGDPISLGGSIISTFCVVKYTAAGGGSKRIISMGAGTDDTANGFTIFENNSLTDVRVFNNGGFVGTITITGSNWNHLGTIFDGVNNTPYLNNIAQVPVAAVPAFGSSVNIGITTNCGATSNSLTGLIAEVVVAKSIMSAGDRASLDAYFTNKWGV